MKRKPVKLRSKQVRFVAHRKEEKLRRLELDATTRLAAEEKILEGGPFISDSIIYERARTEHLEEVFVVKKEDK